MYLTALEIRKIKIMIAMGAMAVLVIYFYFIVPQAIQDIYEFLFLFVLHVAIFMTTYRWLTPTALRMVRFRLRLLLGFLLLQLLLLVMLLVGISLLSGALTWSEHSDWSISNFMDIFLIFLLPKLLGFLIFMLDRGLDGWHEVAVHKARNNELHMEIMKLEFQFYQQQLAPHFMFNTLSTIRSLMRNAPQKATKALTITIDILKFYLAHHGKRYISFQQELQQVDCLLKIYSIRMDSKLFFHYHIDPWVLHNGNIPAMLLFNLVENCCQYGEVTDSARPTSVEVTRMDRGQIHIEIMNAIAEEVLEDVESGNNQLERMLEGIKLLDENNEMFIENRVDTFCVKILLANQHAYN